MEDTFLVPRLREQVLFGVRQELWNREGDGNPKTFQVFIANGACHSAILSRPEQVHDQARCNECTYTAIPGGRKDPVKVMRIAFSVTVDRRGLQDPWVITSLEKQHPLFQCLQPRTLQFMTASCILYEELRDRSTKILNTMEMLISLSEPSHTVYRSRIITLCLTNTRDKK